MARRPQSHQKHPISEFCETSNRSKQGQDGLEMAALTLESKCENSQIFLKSVANFDLRTLNAC